MADEPTVENVRKIIEHKLKNSDIAVNVKSSDGKSFEITLIKGTEEAKKTINVTKKDKPNNSPEDKKDNVVNNKVELENTIKDKLKEFPSEIPLVIKDGSTLQDSLNAVSKIMKENPDLNYGYAGCGAEQYGNKINLKMKYSLPQEKMIEEKNAVDQKVREIFHNNIKAGMSAFEKEKVLHDYLVKNARYDIEHVNDNPPLPEDHNAYGVLVKGVGVCESYAKAFCVLLKHANIECKYVTGKGQNPQGGSERHGWNMVKLDDQWYNVDVTWDDPTYSKPEDQIVDVSYRYFNVTDDILNQDHTRDAESKNLPTCTGKRYSVEGMNIVECDMKGNPFIPVKSEEELKNKVKEALLAKKDTLNLKINWKNTKSLSDFMNMANKVAKNNGISNGIAIKGNDQVIIYTFK
ncbi:transglutaminase [Clostridiaceae bacterium 14S0207]|nr:transglutaminase [Clostridiaceae bacterium 14S0207]